MGAARTGLEVMHPRQRRHHVPSSLGLPPRIDDRASAFAHMLIVPIPGLRVDRFPDGAQQFQIARSYFSTYSGPLPISAADRGWCGIELIDLVLFADRPEPASVRIGRDALEHERGRAIGQWPIDNVAVTGDPAHIRRAPEDVPIVVIERHLMGQRA